MNMPFKDLTGQHFGRLIAIKPLSERSHRSVVWQCQCSCGNVVNISSHSLSSGGARSCGCLKRKDLTGQRFGRLVAVKPLKERRGRCVVWKCQCDCGNVVNVVSSDLLSGTKSCGCLRIKDLTGQRFGKLVAVRVLPERQNHRIVWECLCDCGNTVAILGDSLRIGRTGSCGCLSANPNLTEEQRGRNFPEYIEWRDAVYKRDGYTCQHCGDSIGGTLNAHHIDGYHNNPELRTTLSNGITLCEKCHKNFHHQYGRGDNTREQFDEWMKAKVNTNDN